MSDPAAIPAAAAVAPHAWTRAVAAVITIVALFSMGICLFFVKVPPENKDLLLSFMSFATGVVAQSVYSWLFTGSVSSEAKSDTIGKALNKE